MHVVVLVSCPTFCFGAIVSNLHYYLRNHLSIQKQRILQLFQHEDESKKLMQSNGDYVIEDRSIRVICLVNGSRYKQYRRGKLLGKGSSSCVYEFESLCSSTIYAAKVISKENLQSASARERLVSEFKIHKSLNHPHIVRFSRYFEDKYNVYLLMERCRGPISLEREQQRLSEPAAQHVFAQLISAVQYLHTNHIIHKDIKLKNILITDDRSGEPHISLCDFGLSALLQDQSSLCFKTAGTPLYMSPEVLAGLGHNYAVDLWGLGVVLYALLVGITPFAASTRTEVYHNIRTLTYSYPADHGLSTDAQSLINALLQKDPTCRMPLNTIKDHPFMQKNERRLGVWFKPFQPVTPVDDSQSSETITTLAL